MSASYSCINMITQQLRTGGVLDERILDLFNTIPRGHFVPKHLAHFAYSDMPLPLDHGQFMLTPLEEGKILQALSLQGTETVLEIGTGTGFFTALLSHMAARVISVDYFAQFTQQAEKKLAANPQYTNVELITGNGANGWLDKAPYDVIVFTGALERLTPSHQLQIVPGGKLFAIVGTAPIMQGMLYQFNHDQTWESSLIFETCVPQLLGQIKPESFIF